MQLLVQNEANFSEDKLCQLQLFLCFSVLKRHESFSNTCNHAVNVYALITKKSAGDKLIFVIVVTFTAFWKFQAKATVNI